MFNVSPKTKKPRDVQDRRAFKFSDFKTEPNIRSSPYLSNIYAALFARLAHGETGYETI